jgi:DNA polymerase IV
LQGEVAAVASSLAELIGGAHDFRQITRSKSFDDAIDSLADLERLSLGLLELLLPPRKGVRLLGISLSSLTQARATGRQLSLVLR